MYRKNPIITPKYNSFFHNEYSIKVFESELSNKTSYIPITYKLCFEKCQEVQDFLAFEDGTDTLSRNVGKGLPLDNA
jgi:hypothetical protein